MPIDNATWHPRVGIFYAVKSLHKSKPKPKSISSLHFFLICWNYFVTFNLNIIHHVFDRSLPNKCLNIYSSLIAKILKKTKITIFLFLCTLNLLIQYGDIETNPGPKYSSLQFCHWNLNGITAHHSIKISLLQAYITQRNYDIICLSETFLNSSIQSDDDKIKIDGYNLKRSDHSSGSKRGGVCIYYKEYIPLIKRDDLCTLDNCLVTEIRSQNEKCSFHVSTVLQVKIVTNLEIFA